MLTPSMFFRARLCLVVMALIFAGPGFHLSAQENDSSNSKLGSEPIELENTQKLTSPLIPPQEAVKMLKMPVGFHAKVFAAEPDIYQPIAITTDTKGRVWIAECFTYSDSKTNYDTSYNDRILIFEDVDGDGVADKRKVFWDGGKRLTSVEVGHGGVWVLCSPNLLFIPDRDGDDVPDGEPEVLLDGFNSDFIRHNMVNGLRWGPDGWLYGRHGIQGTSVVGVPGSSESQRATLNCSIWRFHPRTKEFEVICEGTTNPWGHDWNQYGEMFIVNSVIGHLWHVVPGVRFRRMYGSHFNPYTYEVVEQTADHFHFSGKEVWSDVKKNGISSETDDLGGGHAHCGAMIYQGDNWPEKYRGELFTANFHGRRLNQETLVREGNSYTGKRADDLIKSDDLWFRGVDMTYGPDGSVLLLDWSDIGECHENDGIHRTSGRVYRVAFGQTKKVDADVQSKNVPQLFKLLGHKNKWFARKASLRLQEKAFANEATKTKILKLLDERIASSQSNEQEQVNLLLQSIWLKHAIVYDQIANTEQPNESTIEQLKLLAKHDNEHVRAWAIRIATDHPTDEIASVVMDPLLSLSSQDASSLVRLYLASAMRNMSNDQRLAMATSLAENEQDANDRVQPKLIWYNLEPAVIQDFETSLSLAQSTKLPHLRRCIIRRLTAEIDSHPEFVESILDWAAEDNAPTLQILSAVNDSLAGRRSVAVPENWDTVSNRLMNRDDEKVSESLAYLGSVFGEGASKDQLIKIAENKDLDPVARRQAIKTLAESGTDGLLGTFQGLIWDRGVAAQVVRSMSNFREPKIAKIILGRFPAFDPETERGAIATLCSRKEWAGKLLEAVAVGRIAKEKINASHARQIVLLDDKALNDALREHWGVIQESSAEKLKSMERFRSLVNSKERTPNLEHGAKLFKTHCASCHVLYGEGGQRGPDLTGSDRKNVEYLLENIVDPSSTVADTYRSSILQLEDGRTLVGIVTNESDTTLKLLMAEEELVLETKLIEARKNTEKSLMPDGLLDKLTEQEVTDLFGYLRR